MTTAKVATSTWQEIKAKKFSPAQLQQLDDGVEQELLEIWTCAPYAKRG